MNAPFPIRVSARSAGSKAAIGTSMGPMEEAQFEADLLELKPFLAFFARSLAGDRELAEDLTQDTLLNAWRARSGFKPGTNLKAWLCIIMRHRYYSHLRRSWRQMPWDQAFAEDISDNALPQSNVLDLADTLRALKSMPASQREALTLVGAGGFSYGEAARICNCKEGTLKSRVTRARQVLVALLEGDKALPARDIKGGDAIEVVAAALASLAFGAGKIGLRTR